MTRLANEERLAKAWADACCIVTINVSMDAAASVMSLVSSGLGSGLVAKNTRLVAVSTLRTIS